MNECTLITMRFSSELKTLSDIHANSLNIRSVNWRILQQNCTHISD